MLATFEPPSQLSSSLGMYCGCFFASSLSLVSSALTAAYICIGSSKSLAFSFNHLTRCAGTSKNFALFLEKNLFIDTPPSPPRNPTALWTASGFCLRRSCSLLYGNILRTELFAFSHVPLGPVFFLHKKRGKDLIVPDP